MTDLTEPVRRTLNQNILKFSHEIEAIANRIIPAYKRVVQPIAKLIPAVYQRKNDTCDTGQERF